MALTLAMRQMLSFLALGLGLTACGVDPDLIDDILDGGGDFDPSASGGDSSTSSGPEPATDTAEPGECFGEAGGVVDGPEPECEFMQTCEGDAEYRIECGEGECACFYGGEMIGGCELGAQCEVGFGGFDPSDPVFAECCGWDVSPGTGTTGAEGGEVGGSWGEVSSGTSGGSDKGESDVGGTSSSSTGGPGCDPEQGGEVGEVGGGPDGCEFVHSCGGGIEYTFVCEGEQCECLQDGETVAFCEMMDGICEVGFGGGNEFGFDPFAPPVVDCCGWSP